MIHAFLSITINHVPTDHTNGFDRDLTFARTLLRGEEVRYRVRNSTVHRMSWLVGIAFQLHFTDLNVKRTQPFTVDLSPRNEKPTAPAR